MPMPLPFIRCAPVLFLVPFTVADYVQKLLNDSNEPEHMAVNEMPSKFVFFFMEKRIITLFTIHITFINCR